MKKKYNEMRKQEFLNDFKISQNLKYKALEKLDSDVLKNPENFNALINKRIENIGKKNETDSNETIEINIKKMLNNIGIKIPQDEKVVFEIKSQELKPIIERDDAATKIQAVERGRQARNRRRGGGKSRRLKKSKSNKTKKKNKKYN